MLKAGYSDKKRVVDILSRSFEDNKSVNYIIKQDSKRIQRIRKLMEYSFDVCFLFGKVFITDNKKGCALIVLPDKKRTTFRSMVLDIQLIITCIGLSNIKKTMEREVKIKRLQPNQPMYYLWFIGVEPAEQNQGIGSNLLTEIIRESEAENRIVCLETSSVKNLPWYQKFGFKVYNELTLSYQLFFLKK